MYVDDLIYTGNSEDLLMSFRKDMKAKFEMTDLGLMKFFLGMEIIQSSTGIFFITN